MREVSLEGNIWKLILDLLSLRNAYWMVINNRVEGGYFELECREGMGWR